MCTLAAPAHAGSAHQHRWDCPPAASALGYSDALDKLQADDAEVGGLSALEYDARRHAFAAIEEFEKMHAKPASVFYFDVPSGDHFDFQRALGEAIALADAAE